MSGVLRVSLWAAAIAMVALLSVSVDGRAARGGEVHRQVDLQGSPFGVFYGVPPGKGRPTTEYLQQLGVHWTRQTLEWRSVEPRRGVFRWGVIDSAVKLIDASQRAGFPVEVLVTVRARTPWAGQGGPAAKRREATVPPANLQDYYRFLNATVKRAKGRIRYWQIENEVYTPTFWTGTPEQYLELLRTAYRAVKDADPNAQVVLPGIGAWLFPLEEDLFNAGKGEEALRLYRIWAQDNPLAPPQSPSTPKQLAQLGAKSKGASREGPFVRALLGKSNAPFFDIVDLHIYHPYQLIPAAVEWTQQTMAKQGYSKPVWITETSGPTVPALWSNDSVGERRQAEQVVKRCALGIASGAQRVFWFALQTPQYMAKAGKPQYGLLRPNGSKRPAFATLALMTRLLEGARQVRTLRVPSGHAFEFVRPQGSVYVLWSDTGGTVPVPAAAGRLDIVDALGNRTSREVGAGGLELPLSSTPIFVTSAHRLGTVGGTGAAPSKVAASPPQARSRAARTARGCGSAAAARIFAPGTSG